VVDYKKATSTAFNKQTAGSCEISEIWFAVHTTSVQFRAPEEED